MHWYGARNLDQTITLDRGREWPLRDEEAFVLMVMLYDIVPALTKIPFDITSRRTLDQGVDIMPGMGCFPLLRTAQGCRMEMIRGVPAIKVILFLNQWIKSTYKGIGTIHNRNLLVERFNRMV
jgi:hypothetical protein